MNCELDLSGLAKIRLKFCFKNWLSKVEGIRLGTQTKMVLVLTLTSCPNLMKIHENKHESIINNDAKVILSGTLDVQSEADFNQCCEH